MPAPNEALTLPNVLYGFFGAGIAALFSWLANSALKHTERRRARQDDTEAAEIKAQVEDRQNFRLAQQQLIEGLRNRIKDSEDDLASLRKHFREMQIALAETQGELRLARGRAEDCELLHKSDAMRISTLERENLELHERIVALESYMEKP
jgi:sensor domain CHASE-containing protein